MKCRNVRHEIETADLDGVLSLAATEHLAICQACATFSREHASLLGMVSSLGTIEAPGDFEFRLRARLAGEKSRGANSFATGKFSFGLRSAALATLLLMFGSAMLLVSLRSTPDNSPDNSTPAKMASKTSPVTNTTAQENQSGLAEVKAELPAAPVSTGAKPQGTRPALAPARNTGRIRTRDMASATAPVVRREELRASADFPIEASNQSLKVSLDDGRGSSRTISLPTVSFGSQRVVSQTNSPLVASARGAW